MLLSLIFDLSYLTVKSLYRLTKYMIFGSEPNHYKALEYRICQLEQRELCKN